MENYRDIYESNRMELVRNLRVHRTFLFDYLRSKKVLDKEECELVQVEVTSERKAGKFLDLLGHKGKEGFKCFTEALQLESPELYQLLTGKDAQSTPNPILMRYQNSRLGREGGMEEDEMELLTEHLSTSYAELQQISTQYNNLVKEKRKLKGQLMMNEADLERQRSQVTAWEEKFKQEKTTTLKKQTRAEKCMYTMAFEIELERDTIKNLEADIIGLKIQLLQANDEIDELKSASSRANTKQEQEMRNRQEIGENYEKERKQAARLSLIVKSQEDELHILDNYKRKCGGLENLNDQLKEENEKLQKELNELAKWTKGLKDRFDLIENENNRTNDSNKNVAENIKALQDENKSLKHKASFLQIENDFLKFRVTFVEKDGEIYKQQRDTAITSRNEAVGERDKVWRERELAWRNYMESQKARDCEIEKRESCMKQLDEKEALFNETFAELSKTTLKLNEAKLIMEELQLDMKEMKKTERTQDEDTNPVTIQPKRRISEDDLECGRLNSKKDLIRSLKRRVDRNNRENINPKAHSLNQNRPNFGFLMSMVCDFSEDNDDEFGLANKPMNKWASCPQLDDNSHAEKQTIRQLTTRRSVTIDVPPVSLNLLNNPDKQDTRECEETQGTEESTSDSFSSDSDDPPKYPNRPLEEVNEWVGEKAFRRRSNQISFNSDVPFRRRMLTRRKNIEIQAKITHLKYNSSQETFM